MPKPDNSEQNDPSHLSNDSWAKQIVFNVIDLRKKFEFETPDLGLDFITTLMEMEHHDGETIIETTSVFQNLIVEVSIFSTKEKIAEHLIKLIETTYSRVK